MSRYGSIAVTSPSSVLTRIVESSEPADLQARVNAAIAALPGGSVVTALTLAGAGDGALFTVTIEAGAAADVTGGFASPPSVTCFLGANAESMLVAHGVVSNGAFADAQVAGASKGTRFMGMLVKGTVVGGDTGTISPFSNLAYVDIGTSTPGPDQTGSVAAPFSTVQAAVDAGFSAMYITGDSLSETVTAPATLFLTGANTSVSLQGLTLPDNATAILDNVSVGTLIAGDGGLVITNASVGDATFGINGFLILNGPGAVSFPVKVDLLPVGNVTMGAGGTLLGTNGVFSAAGTVVADVVELFGWTSSLASLTAVSLNAQNSVFTVGDYTTTGEVVLENVKVEGPVSFLNAPGQEFRTDGLTAYWLNRNAVTFSNGNERVITEEITRLSVLAYVDYGTTVAAAAQTGSIANPYSTVQAALDAGFIQVHIVGGSGEDVVAPGFVLLTGADRGTGFNSLTIPDGAGAILDNVGLVNLTAGDGCNVITNNSVGTAVFGNNGIFILNGPGALSFVSKADQLALGDVTMGTGGTVLGTNTVFSDGAAVVANTVEMFGCTSLSDVTSETLNAQNSAITGGTYTTTGQVDLQNVKCDAGVAFDNALGQPFNLDGFSNYWIKTNAVALTNAGEKVITDDLTP